jgi:hypothetical protein
MDQGDRQMTEPPLWLQISVLAFAAFTAGHAGAKKDKKAEWLFVIITAFVGAQICGVF